MELDTLEVQYFEQLKFYSSFIFFRQLTNLNLAVYLHSRYTNKYIGYIFKNHYVVVIYRDLKDTSSMYLKLVLSQ